MYLRLFYCSYYIHFPKAKCWYNSFRSSHLFRNSPPLHSASAIARMVEVVIYCNTGGIFPSKYEEGIKITVEKTKYRGMINILSNILCCAGLYLFFSINTIAEQFSFHKAVPWLSLIMQETLGDVGGLDFFNGCDYKIFLYLLIPFLRFCCLFFFP